MVVSLQRRSSITSFLSEQNAYAQCAVGAVANRVCPVNTGSRCDSKSCPQNVFRGRWCLQANNINLAPSSVTSMPLSPPYASCFSLSSFQAHLGLRNGQLFFNDSYIIYFYSPEIIFMAFLPYPKEYLLMRELFGLVLLALDINILKKTEWNFILKSFYQFHFWMSEVVFLKSLSLTYFKISNVLYS